MFLGFEVAGFGRFFGLELLAGGGFAGRPLTCGSACGRGSPCGWVLVAGAARRPRASSRLCLRGWPSWPPRRPRPRGPCWPLPACFFLTSACSAASVGSRPCSCSAAWHVGGRLGFSGFGGRFAAAAFAAAGAARAAASGSGERHRRPAAADSGRERRRSLADVPGIIRSSHSGCEALRRLSLPELGRFVGAARDGGFLGGLGGAGGLGLGRLFCLAWAVCLLLLGFLLRFGFGLGLGGGFELLDLFGGFLFFLLGLFLGRFFALLGLLGGFLFFFGGVAFGRFFALLGFQGGQHFAIFAGFVVFGPLLFGFFGAFGGGGRDAADGRTWLLSFAPQPVPAPRRATASDNREQRSDSRGEPAGRPRAGITRAEQPTPHKPKLPAVLGTLKVRTGGFAGPAARRSGLDFALQGGGEGDQVAWLAD